MSTPLDLPRTSIVHIPVSQASFFYAWVLDEGDDERSPWPERPLLVFWLGAKTIIRGAHHIWWADICM